MTIKSVGGGDGEEGETAGRIDRGGAVSGRLSGGGL